MFLLFVIYFVGFICANLIAMDTGDPPKEDFSHEEKVYRFTLTFIWPLLAIIFAIYGIYLFFSWPWRD